MSSRTADAVRNPVGRKCLDRHGSSARRISSTSGRASTAGSAHARRRHAASRPGSAAGLRRLRVSRWHAEPVAQGNDRGLGRSPPRVPRPALTPDRARTSKPATPSSRSTSSTPSGERAIDSRDRPRSSGTVASSTTSFASTSTSEASTTGGSTASSWCDVEQAAALVSPAYQDGSTEDEISRRSLRCTASPAGSRTDDGPVS